MVCRVNISLNVNATGAAEEWHNPDTLQGMIDRHREIMEGAEFIIVGPAVLIPETSATYRGSYQVWWPIRNNGVHTWVFINTEGEPLFRASLPRAIEMVR